MQLRTLECATAAIIMTCIYSVELDLHIVMTMCETILQPKTFEARFVYCIIHEKANKYDDVLFDEG